MVNRERDYEGRYDIHVEHSVDVMDDGSGKGEGLEYTR